MAVEAKREERGERGEVEMAKGLEGRRCSRRGGESEDPREVQDR